MRFQGKSYDRAWFRVITGLMMVILGLIFIILSYLLHDLGWAPVIYMMVAGAITTFVGVGFVTSSKVYK